LTLPASLIHWPVHGAEVTNRTDFDTNGPMTAPRDANAETAMQYLLWALEHIEMTGNQKVAHQIRIAMDELRGEPLPSAEATVSHPR
jgi:hypothetical protein